MTAANLDLLVHHVIRLFMREEGMSADEAFDAAIPALLEIAQDIEGGEELTAYCTRLPELRESILPEYRQPHPDLSNLEPVMKARSAAEAEYRRQRRRRRQLSRP